ncbi:S41 family peptidase [Pseudoalteromonas sp. SMS1]|uniref:S41 family peptidase n=1 Tax=Pseudoalteromonas sp. SMS1 TaxID=2908894 RepID=UPI001F295DA5|nr:S41 family peptidase [Pseudoalteromonas sp. SMS1]MCF2859928.1 S41 family peptidase [Pseudoalteromonas sp. SMS1]
MRQTLGLISTIAAAFMLLSGCQDNQDHRSDLQRSAGFWHKPAYGEALNITMNRVIHYQYNRYGCIQTSERNHTSTTTQIDPVALSKTKRLRIARKGQVYPHYYTQLPILPQQCQNPITISSAVAPSVVFEYFWHTFNDYYAFFSIREVNWQAQYDRYRPKINDSMSDDALFDILAEMVAPLQDMHVTLSSSHKDYVSTKPVSIFDAILQEGDGYTYQGEKQTLSSRLIHYQTQLQRISQHYITSDSLNTLPQDSDSATAIWGKTASNIGILVLNNMETYTTNPHADEQQHLDAAHEMMVSVMAALKDSDAMIIDIRYNTGGGDAIALAIAGYFADRDLLAFNKQAINQTGRGIPIRQKLSPHRSAYTKPVYLLTSQLTVSAAEVFTMAMDQLAHVTKVGEETAGSLSDALKFTLPNGWQFSLSNEVYRNAQGDMFEHIGFTPDHHVPAFNHDDMKMRRFETYDFVLNTQNKSSMAKRQLPASGNLNKVTVNIMSQGHTVYSQGFSSATQNPFKAEAPLYLTYLDECDDSRCISTNTHLTHQYGENDAEDDLGESIR